MKKTEPTSTIRTVKGIVTPLTVSTFADEKISDELAQAIIVYLEHQGQLPRQMTLTTDFSVSIQPASWNVTVGEDRYDCHLMADSMEIRRVK